MKNVRIFYTKTDRMKFLSHLDMNRLMIRVIRKSGIPVWYTEGFNQHIYINYAVPLSLGFEGLYEIMDIKLTDDNYDLTQMLNSLNDVAPTGIIFFQAAEPILPTKDITFAKYKVRFDTENFCLYERLREFLSRESVICLKKDKKGRMKEFDIIPRIKETVFNEDSAVLVLSSGNEGNLNPSLVLSAFFENTNTAPVFYTVYRTMIYDGNMAEFK